MKCVPAGLAEKFVPTHCPQCGQNFGDNGDQGFMFDLRPIHGQAPPGFPESIMYEGLFTDLVRCGQCHNVTLRLVTERALVFGDVAVARHRALGFVVLKGEHVGTVPPDYHRYQLVVGEPKT